jgi:stage IV sporulation protein FB
MIRFTIFGVPVEIQPMFWLTGALLGGATRANTQEGLIEVIVFIIIMAISILVHELGHALVGRRLGGGYASITLWGLGGLAYNQGGRFTRSGNFWRIAAGPAAGFALGLLVVLLLCLSFGPVDGANISSYLLFHHLIAIPSEKLITFFSEGGQKINIIHDFLWINFWWGVINLLPVLPLDGGRIADLFVKPQKRVYQIGFITGVAMAIFGLAQMNSLYTAVMFGYLAYQNFQQMKQNSWS